MDICTDMRITFNTIDKLDMYMYISLLIFRCPTQVLPQQSSQTRGMIVWLCLNRLFKLKKKKSFISFLKEKRNGYLIKLSPHFFLKINVPYINCFENNCMQ